MTNNFHPYYYGEEKRVICFTKKENVEVDPRLWFLPGWRYAEHFVVSNLIRELI